MLCIAAYPLHVEYKATGDLEGGIVHYPAECSHWDGASANILVPIPVAVKRCFWIVDMHALRANARPKTAWHWRVTSLQAGLTWEQWEGVCTTLYYAWLEGVHLGKDQAILFLKQPAGSQHRGRNNWLWTLEKGTGLEGFIRTSSPEDIEARLHHQSL